MNIALMILMGVAMIAAGAAATFMMVVTIPERVLQKAEEHGRFAGLSGDAHTFPEADATLPRRPSHQMVDVV